MDKKLPNVFANKIDENINNNEKVFYSEAREVVTENTNKTNNKTIYQKINEIFRSKDYVYKADVIITLKDKTIKKKIIGKNNNYLITLENELIPLVEIVDIKKSTN